MKNINFFKGNFGISDVKYIKETLKSGWLTSGPKTLLFEKKFKDAVKAKHAISVNSCTAALHLALRALNLKKGTKVIVPSWTFASTLEVVLYLGLKPILVDIDLKKKIITPEILINALNKNKNIGALIIVHFAGKSAQMYDRGKIKGINNICKKKNIKIIEDCAHAFRTMEGKKVVGNTSNICCFSFYANKTLTTGEGGMITTNNKKIAEKVKILRQHGMSRNIWNRYTNKSNQWEYDIIDLGYKYNLPDINSSIGLSQLKKFKKNQYKRSLIAKHYHSKLKNISKIILPEINNKELKNNSWHIFSISISNFKIKQRDKLIEKLYKCGISASVHYKPLHLMSYYKKELNLKLSNFPNSNKLWETTISLPIYDQLKKSEINYICNMLIKFIKYDQSI